jgi:N utilization substance protein A
MDGKELLSILDALERDKGVDREVLIQAVEAALATAAKKSEGVSEETEATAAFDRKTGRLTVTVAGRPIDSAHLTRIAAQTAKQVIIQKIREAEREVIVAEFQGRMGDIMTGSVHRFERGDIVVEMGRAEAVLPKAERIPHEEFGQGDRIQGYVLEVRRNAKGPAVVLSRAHEGFVRGLFVLEVPEIAEGIVEIKGIAREAGDRTKIAVASRDERVDCVGACVGMRGTRVKNIVRELHGEKVDIIRWQEDPKEFIAAALSPAKIVEIQAQLEAKQALVMVEDDQLSLAIGKKGQNVRLASKLTGWQLEIVSRAKPAIPTVDRGALRDLPGVGPSLEERLKEAGITSIEQLAAQSLEQLTAVKGLGEKTAAKLLEAAQAALATPPPVAGDQSPAVNEQPDAPSPSPEGGAAPLRESEPESGDQGDAGDATEPSSA